MRICSRVVEPEGLPVEVCPLPSDGARRQPSPHWDPRGREKTLPTEQLRHAQVQQSLVGLSQWRLPQPQSSQHLPAESESADESSSADCPCKTKTGRNVEPLALLWFNGVTESPPSCIQP